jgi:carbon monoxide dehydrogenase subunit G
VSTVVDAPPARVWDYVRDVATHIEWMDDAVAIRFISAQRQGVGTTFECDTRIGPLRLTDTMVVTSWEPGRAIGIRHHGLIGGTGRLTLRRRGRRRTKVTWAERLRFPWWLGGPAGALVGGRVLRRVWRRDLANLRGRFSSAAAEPGGC